MASMNTGVLEATSVTLIGVERPGGPEATGRDQDLVDVPWASPGPGEIRIRHHACGLNFIDVYQRTGLYQPHAADPGHGRRRHRRAVGEGVTHLKAGDRAAYASNPPGSYSEARVMPAKNVCKLPDAISFETGAAMMLKGLTAQYLLRRTLPVRACSRATMCCSMPPPAVWA
jgi:NADPH2:quinone reductase